jgi:DMSO/TMAO reductase YedYZ molybdopterin-dependent catalytic subunit
VLHVVATVVALRRPRMTQRVTDVVTGPVQRALSRSLPSRQHYCREDVSAFHRVNGLPPAGDDYAALAREGFGGYRLTLGRLVRHPQDLSLDALRNLGMHSQIVNHNCIQGWNAIAEWSGVPFAAVMNLVQPLAQVRYAVFHAMDDKGQTDPEPGHHGHVYEAVPVHLLWQEQAILALKMNGSPPACGWRTSSASRWSSGSRRSRSSRASR